MWSILFQLTLLARKLLCIVPVESECYVGSLERVSLKLLYECIVREDGMHVASGIVLFLLVVVLSGKAVVSSRHEAFNLWTALTPQEEFENEPEGKCLEAEEWNDSVIKELQKRIYDSDAALSMEDDQEMNEPFEGRM